MSADPLTKSGYRIYFVSGSLLIDSPSGEALPPEEIVRAFYAEETLPKGVKVTEQLSPYISARNMRTAKRPTS